MSEQLRHPGANREEVYQVWHRSLKGDLRACNLDQVEYSVEGGSVRIYALIETTRTGRDFGDLDAIWARLDPDGPGGPYPANRCKKQMVMMRWLGCHVLHIPTLVTVYNKECSRFAVRNLLPHTRTALVPIADSWNMMEADVYHDLLRGLRERNDR